MTIDMDSTICQVHGKAKHGAAYGYTRGLGYHPLVATRAATGEVLHARLRKGSSQRGHKRFIQELVARVRRAGAAGPLVVRADSGFFSYALIDTLSASGSAGRSRSASALAYVPVSKPLTSRPGRPSSIPTAALPRDIQSRHHWRRSRYSGFTQSPLWRPPAIIGRYIRHQVAEGGISDPRD